MVLKDTALAIIAGAVNSNDNDKIEAYQFIADNGLWQELTAKELLILRELIEADKVFTPPLYILQNRD